MANQEKRLHALSKKTKQIDNNVIEQILIRVPARYLHRFQLVCKTWRAMMQKPWFKKTHLELNNRTNEPLQLLVLKDVVDHRVVHEETVVVDKDLQPYKIWMPQDLGSDGHFRGSCNGLFCTEVRGEITVFNPVTREVVSLPKPTNIKGYGSAGLEETYTEFVFHFATGEYKVILFYWNASMEMCTVNMFILGANSSWRQVGEISEFPCNVGVNVDDTVYWSYFPLDEGYDPFIVSFDLNKEEFATVSSPMQDAILVGLTKWHGRLCEASFRKERQSINIWTLDNSTEHLWTLRHEIQLREIDGDVQLLAPYSIKTNRVFIATSEKIFYHEISGKRNNIKEIKVKYTCEIKNCFAYVESLLPVPK